MSEGQSGSLLAPLIFIICLAILPGASGFFLAIFVLIAINVIVNERRRREDLSPMPNRRVLKLPDPRAAVQDRAEAKEQSAEILYGEEVFKIHIKDKGQPFSFSCPSRSEASEIHKPIFCG